MKPQNTSSKKDVATRTALLCIIFALAGLLLIACSAILGYRHEAEYLREFVKETGIVLFAVFTISLLYERLLAERHLEAFGALMQDQVERAVDNAAACSELGIMKIFTRRDLFEMEYPLEVTLGTLGKGGSVRIVAVSLFHIMNKSEQLKEAVERGCKVELCLLNPLSSPTQIAKLPDLEPEDIGSAVAVFAKRVSSWLETTRPLGIVELRYHEVAVPESFSHFSSSPLGSLGVWDLSFGRDVRDKRIILVDPLKPLGLDLRKRFDFVFNNATVVYRYDDGIKINKVEAVKDRPSVLPLRV